MKNVYGYIRVSDPKQGKGVSLIAQKEAISQYARKNNLHIIQWFEEIKTAAKQGRPIFLQMIKLLKKRKADGVVIHKIDRSARNLNDWTKIRNLNDIGVEVYFAHESIDMNEQSGQLSADIQAVIAANYIRNLRQETIKGIYGRLNQGLYPFQAPVGYLDMGKGQPKKIDKKKAPLVKDILQKYSTGLYTQKDMIDEANLIGLTNHSGAKITKTSISTILSNSFYTGILKVKGKSFKGIHEPLITMNLYEKIQDVLHKRTNNKVNKHHFLFRQLFQCKYCKYTLIGERQKGRNYYRCHTKNCVTKGLREDYIEQKLTDLLSSITLTQNEKTSFLKIIKKETEDEEQQIKEMQNSLNLQKGAAEEKLDVLVDALIEGVIDKTIYENRKFKILTQIQKTEHQLKELEQQKSDFSQNIQKFLELIKSLKNIYILGNRLEKRRILELVTSNLLIEGKNLLISMQSPFQDLAKLCLVPVGLPTPTEPRTGIAKTLIKKVRGVEYLVIGLDTVIHKRPSLGKEKIKPLMFKIFEQ